MAVGADVRIAETAEDEIIDVNSSNTTLVDRFTLSNGLRVVTEDIPWVESVTIGFFVLVGSSYESRKLNGISHVLEHILFKGTKRRSARDIVIDIESLGGVINAGTGKELTNYYCRIYHKHLPQALDVLIDLMFHSIFPAPEIEREKWVILEEIKMGEDNPDEFLIDRFYRNIYGDTALGRRIIGTEQTVSSFTRDDIIGFHHEHYVPSNMVLSVSGKLNGKNFRKLLEDSFKKARLWKQAKPRKRTLKIKPKYRPARFMLRKDVEQTTLVLGFPSVSFYNPDRYPFAIMDAYLSGGMSSRLFQEVREKRGLVYSIDSTQAPMSPCGLYTIDAGMTLENTPKVARLVGKELKRIAEKGITAKNLKNAREYIKGIMLLGLESSVARMSRNGVGELFHQRYIPMSELVALLDKVQRDDIQALAKKVFRDDMLAIGILTSENAEVNEDEFLRRITREFMQA